MLKRDTQRAGLPKIRVAHRHSQASLLINAGVSLYVVSRHLGHCDIQTTVNTYGHLYPNTENEIAGILNERYKESN
ncbi:tyrosine-type recombinase/integrase [Staphylococcus capitis]|nr:tyrosine-type recombinase/integrase [Staphylococcus capitis]MBF2281579.1 tyrosine-type recombinase/integrase [Staphylococcus capitis]